jgi:hypothetical protein
MARTNTLAYFATTSTTKKKEKTLRFSTDLQRRIETRFKMIKSEDEQKQKNELKVSKFETK